MMESDLKLSQHLGPGTACWVGKSHRARAHSPVCLSSSSTTSSLRPDFNSNPRFWFYLRRNVACAWSLNFGVIPMFWLIPHLSHVHFECIYLFSYCNPMVENNQPSRLKFQRLMLAASSLNEPMIYLFSFQDCLKPKEWRCDLQCSWGIKQLSFTIIRVGKEKQNQNLRANLSCYLTQLPDNLLRIIINHHHYARMAFLPTPESFPFPLNVPSCFI